MFDGDAIGKIDECLSNKTRKLLLESLDTSERGPVVLKITHRHDVERPWRAGYGAIFDKDDLSCGLPRGNHATLKHDIGVVAGKVTNHKVRFDDPLPDLLL